MRVALYTRISTDEDHQKYSLDAQRDRLEAYCKSQYDDYTVFKIYRDTSTGTNMNRPALEEMLAAAEARKFDALVVFRVDRLSRNVRQLAQMVEMLTEYNIVLRSATEPFDTANAAGKMMMQMLGVFAEFEHATIIERTRVALERKARNGEWCGGFVPYGYKRDEEGLIEIEESEATIVRRIFRNYVFGQKGATKIFKELNDAGLRKRSGIPWDNRAIIVILKNPFYTGVIHWKDKIFPGKHEPLISQELFDKAQALFEKRNVQPKGERFKAASDFFLTGLIFCGKCGKGLVGRAAHRNGHRHKYYSCSNRTYHRGCKLPFIRADIVEVLTIKEIQSIFRQPELLEKVWQLVNTKLQEERPQKQNEICKVAEDIVKTKSALERYFVEFEAGSIEQDVLRDRVMGLNLRIQQLQEEKAKLEEELEMLNLEGIDQDGIKAYIDALEVVLENGENEQKKHLLRVLVEKVLVHDKDRYEFWFRLPDGKIFDQSFQTAENGDSNSLSVSHLAEQVCNHIQLAPQMCLIASRKRSEAIFTINLIKNRKTRKYEFRRDKVAVFLLIPQKKSSQEMGVILNDVSHFLYPDLPLWLPAQRYPITLEEKRIKRMELVIEWQQGLASGFYINYADIARKNGCSRAWVSRMLNQNGAFLKIPFDNNFSLA